MTPRVRELVRGLAFPEGPVVDDDGAVLVSEMAGGRVIRIAPDGTTAVVAETGGGPNGLGQLPDGRLLVCQGGGSRWQTRPWPFDLPGSVDLTLPAGPAEDALIPQVQLIDRDGAVTTLTDRFVGVDGVERALGRPSDVCVDAEGGFWMTDGGASHGRDRGLSGVLYGAPDRAPGTPLREVLYPLEMPNGVALSADGTRLYVTETRTRRVWELGVGSRGRIEAARGFATVPSGGPMNFGGADGVCVDDAGRVIVATLGTGGVTVFSPNGEQLGALVLDDPMTSNAVFDPTSRSLFVTLGSTGTVVAIDDWPAGVVADQ
jgi:gluconolactonase